MKDPVLTGKYNVRLKDTKENKTVYTARWYFAPDPAKKEKGGWSFDTGRYILTDYDPEPISGTTKEEWRPLTECEDANVGDLAAAIIKLAIEDATINTVEQRPLYEEQKTERGNITRNMHKRHLKDHARKYLHNQEYKWLYPDTNIDALRFKYKEELMRKDAMKTEIFFNSLNNKQIEKYLKKSGLENFAKIKSAYKHNVDKLGYEAEVRNALKKTTTVYNKETKDHE